MPSLIQMRFLGGEKMVVMNLILPATCISLILTLRLQISAYFYKMKLTTVDSPAC